jgi:Zn-dependent protease/predicted transcriptional regulator
MKWSLYVGRPWGIRVYLHWTFLLLIVWILVAQWENPARQILNIAVFTILLFGSVLLHEFGHALVARRFNVKTKDIILLPIGGMARLKKMPEEPRAEFWIALAGPLVNATIALVLAAALLAIHGTIRIPEEMELASGAHSILLNLLYANALLAGFNLIPAFPMDGGRVLRALLGFRISHERATSIAAEVGQVIGIGFVILGFFYSIVLIFIGIFVYLGASAEASGEQLRTTLRAYRVSNILMKDYTALKPDQGIMDAVELLLAGQEEEFLVIDDSVVGVISKKEIFEGLAKYGNHVSVQKIMIRDFPSLRYESSLEEALALLQEKNCPLAPVYRGQKLAGILDRTNIEELLTLNRAMQQYVESPTSSA